MFCTDINFIQLARSATFWHPVPRWSNSSVGKDGFALLVGWCCFELPWFTQMFVFWSSSYVSYHTRTTSQADAQRGRGRAFVAAGGRADAMLMPEEPIGELFRSFPAPDGWGGHRLEPDLAAYGMFKLKEAALFVEYDGYWRHAEKEGIEKDRVKNEALLKYSPFGSQVIRIGHTLPTQRIDNVLSIRIDTWRQGDKKALSKILTDLLDQAVSALKELFDESLAKRLTLLMNGRVIQISGAAESFLTSAVLLGTGNTTEEISSFLVSEGFDPKLVQIMITRAPMCGLSIARTLEPKLLFLLDLGLTKSQVAKTIARFPSILGCSIELNLKPTVQWLLDLGLKKTQVAKTVAGFPSILGCSIELNLKPTVQWLLDLCLTKTQVAKTVAGFPSILGYSIELNLKPTVQWLLDLGLTKSQVTKVVAAKPQVFGYSIELNLKPTVHWLLDLGLTKSQVTKVVAAQPQVFGCSIELNLKPTVQWLLDLGLTKTQVAKTVAGFPSILGYSIELNLKPTVQWLLDLGLKKTQVAKTVAGFPSILGCSIELNLKPTVQWLLDLGLTKSQVTKVVAAKPQVFGCSIELNLKPTVQWLLDLCLTKTQVAKTVAGFPSILGYSIELNLKPTVQWLLDLGLTKSQVTKVVAAKPQVFGYSIELNLKPTVQWLLDLGLTKTQVAKTVAGFPSILGCSIELNLKPTVQWLLDLGLTKSQVTKVVAVKPQVFGYSIERNLERKALFLQNILSKGGCAGLVAKFPPILGLSWERLTSRVNFLEKLNATDEIAYAMALTESAYQRFAKRVKDERSKTTSLSASEQQIKNGFLPRHTLPFVVSKKKKHEPLYAGRLSTGFCLKTPSLENLAGRALGTL